MITLDFTNVALEQLITHRVGNKLRDEKYLLSSETTIVEEESQDFLLKYFLLPAKAEEFHSFTHSLRLELNEVCSVVEKIFSNPKSFIQNSQDIAKLLYEQSLHPKIKGGELNVAYFSNVIFNGEAVEAVGIFKSETHVPFLKMRSEKTRFNINHDYGFEIKGIDKGCIVFNTDPQSGYKVIVIDNANKSIEARYWKDDFLKVKPVANEFHQTNQFLGIAKDFVTKQLSEEFEVSKADKIDLLNRSVDYFKKHESFDKKEFEKDVFQDRSIIESFRNFDYNYREENNVEIKDNFDISSQAVRMQARVFKNVLKLDKNFDIYIHGNTDLIEQGVEKDGRKFYKIYFQHES